MNTRGTNPICLLLHHFQRTMMAVANPIRLVTAAADAMPRGSAETPPLGRFAPYPAAVPPRQIPVGISRSLGVRLERPVTPKPAVVPRT